MHPILLRLQGVPVYSFGVVLHTSLLSSLVLMMLLARKDSIAGRVLAIGAAFMVLGGLIGGRVFYFLGDGTPSVGELFNLRRGGLSGIGAVLGAFVALWGACRLNRVRFLAVADLMAPGVALMSGLTRIGCYLFGCDFGVPLSAGAPGWLKRAGTFPHWAEGTLEGGSGSPAWVQHVKERGLSISSDHSLPVHPTQLYELVVGLVIAFGLLIGFTRWNDANDSTERPAHLVFARRRFRGHVFLTFVFLASTARYLVEILRDDGERGIGPFGLPAPIIIPLGAAALGLAGVFAFVPDEAVTQRRVAYAVSALPALLLYLAMRPTDGTSFINMGAWSLPQAIVLVAGVAAALMIRRLSRRALADPEGAMAVEDRSTEPPKEDLRKKKRRTKKDA